MLAFENLQRSHSDTGSHHNNNTTSPLKTERRQSEHKSNLFEILLWCQEIPNPGCYLLAEGVRHHAPFLSVLAACFHVRIIQKCFSFRDMIQYKEKCIHLETIQTIASHTYVRGQMHMLHTPSIPQLSK